MPRRGIPGTYPAPPFECMAKGLIGLRPCIPVPCSRVIFSSMVISFNTMAARSSGESELFIQGSAEGLSCGLDCSRDGNRTQARRTLARTTIADGDRLALGEPAGKIMNSPLTRNVRKAPTKSLMLTFFRDSCRILYRAPDMLTAPSSSCGLGPGPWPALHLKCEDCAGTGQSDGRRFWGKLGQDHPVFSPRSSGRRGIDSFSRAFGVWLSAARSGRAAVIRRAQP